MKFTQDMTSVFQGYTLNYNESIKYFLLGLENFVAELEIYLKNP
jgi:hypothetical protein